MFLGLEFFYRKYWERAVPGENRVLLYQASSLYIISFVSLKAHRRGFQPLLMRKPQAQLARIKMAWLKVVWYFTHGIRGGKMRSRIRTRLAILGLFWGYKYTSATESQVSCVTNSGLTTPSCKPQLVLPGRDLLFPIFHLDHYLVVVPSDEQYIYTDSILIRSCRIRLHSILESIRHVSS